MNDKSNFIFKKDLAKKQISELTLDSFIKNQKIQQSAWIEINDLKPVKASASQLPKGLKLSLIVYCGKPEFVGKSHLQSINISNHGGKFTASIFWKVESINYLMSISNCLKTHEYLNIFINLGGEVNLPNSDSSVIIDINHLSVTFS